MANCERGIRMDGFTALALEALVLAAASSIDAFMASFSCGVGKVKIPPKSIWVISGICSLTLGLSLWLGNLLAPFIPAGLAREIGGGLLLLIGVYKLFESLMKGWLRRREREIHFRLFHVRCILKIYVDPTEADLDASSRLSTGEAAALATALSVDGLAAGFGAGLSMGNPVLSGIFSLLLSAAAVFLGCRMGHTLSLHIHTDGAWFSGIVLILLGASKCFF